MSTDFPIRKDLASACESEWARLGQPGTWWTGSERIEIAALARSALHCDLCERRKAALSPHGTDGSHDGSDRLGSHLVDATHRIRTDAGRLTKSWVESLLAHISAPGYVELIGVVVTEAFVDTLALGIGAPLPDLPEPKSGDPHREAPPYATVHSAWVPTVPPERASGVVADVYGLSAYSVVSNVIRALSLVPRELAAQRIRGTATYRSPHLVLSEPQVELVATATSLANDCFY